MRRASELPSLVKVHYRPLEAAIRWSGLARHEQKILRTLAERGRMETGDFPKWPALKLNHDRIYDAIVNRELQFGINGVPTRDHSQIGHPELTVRHVDLRSWMSRYYPGQRPPFLFDASERTTPPLTIDTVNLIVESDRFRALIDRTARDTLNADAEPAPAPTQHPPLNQVKESPTFIGTRGETTYLHIVGSLVGLLLGRAPSGQPYSTFRSQEAVIDALVSHYGDRLGISERTLQSKLAAARRALER